MDIKDSRLKMWLGKFAYGNVNTKKTKLMIAPKHFHDVYLPIVKDTDFKNINDPSYAPYEIEKIILQKYFYNGKRRTLIIRFGYSKKLDVLIVSEETPYELER